MKYLFDFDGTILVDNIYPPQAMAIKLALFETSEVPIRVSEQIDWVGKTDLSIAEEACEKARVSFRREEFIAAYLDWFEDLADGELEVREGMHEVLQWCGKVSLVSGNISQVAALKVERSALSELIDLGTSAFAGQADTRAALILKAADGEDAIYVGDTWRDIEAAREAGVYNIGLVTPKHAADTLAQADFVAATPAALLGHLMGALGLA